MPAQPPTAPPRRKANIKKEDISEPYDFVHLNHVGLDFNSEDVKKAIRHSSDSQLRQEHLYESVSRTETPILSATPPRDDLPPPLEFAPEYGKPSTAAPPVVGRGTEPEIVEYANRPSQHLYMNVNSEKARPSRKKNPPPPPPPQAEKPRRERSEEPAVILRKPATPPPDAPPAEVSCPIQTSQRIDVAPPSVILERPGMLGEMRIGLDDPIPLQTGVPSKYRSPSMLTPREMAVDVPTPMRSPAEETEPADPAPSAPIAVKEVEEVPSAVAPKPVLVKDKAIDIPTPPSKQNKPPRPAPPVINPVLVAAAASSEKRPAPSPPEEPEAAAPKVIYNPYVPLSAARSSPQLKNVISELKVKQGGSGEEAIKEEEEEEGEAAAGEEEVKKSVEEDKNNNVEMINEGKEVKVEQEAKIVKKESQTGADNVRKEGQKVVKKDSDKVKESSTSKVVGKEDKKAKETAELKVSKRDSKKENNNDRKEADRPKESSSKGEKSKEGSRKLSEQPKEFSSSSKKPKEVKKEAPKDESDHEYVAIDGLRRSSPADPRRAVAEQSKPQEVQQAPTPPVPRPRKTVALSEEKNREEEAPKVEDDGIDTGCSDEEDAVVLRL